MNDDLDRSLTALMEHAAAPAEPARVDDIRRQALEGLARARRQARRRRITSLVGTGVLVAGVAAFLVMALPKGDPSEPSGTTTSTAQRLPKPTRAEAPNRPGRWWLYPDRSRVGQAAAAAVGRPTKWVEARRELFGDVLTGGDFASLRDARKDGWELDWFVTFARYEMGGPGTPTAGGEYWFGSRDGTIRSVYYLSDDGIGVWAGHFSPSPEVEPVSEEAPLILAKRFAAELRRRGDFHSTVLDARPGSGRADLTDYRRIPATTVGVGGLPRVDRLRINRGRQDGVRVGAAVLAANREGVLVGVVEEVFPTSAVVSLLRSGGAGVHVALAGQGSTRRTLSATASGQLRITKLPAQAPPFRNQLVFTAGAAPPALIPPGLQVGSVARVERADGGLWTAWVAPSVDARRSLNVTVLGRP